MRTNIEYVPSPDDLCPIAKGAIAFPAKEFLHIKDVRKLLLVDEILFPKSLLLQKFNNDWWIGRLVKLDAQLGFIPSPAKLEMIRIQSNRKNKNQTQPLANTTSRMKASTQSRIGSTWDEEKAPGLRLV